MRITLKRGEAEQLSAALRKGRKVKSGALIKKLEEVTTEARRGSRWAVVIDMSEAGHTALLAAARSGAFPVSLADRLVLALQDWFMSLPSKAPKQPWRGPRVSSSSLGLARGQARPAKGVGRAAGSTSVRAVSGGAAESNRRKH